MLATTPHKQAANTLMLGMTRPYTRSAAWVIYNVNVVGKNKITLYSSNLIFNSN